jgi:hypothetical protein
MEEKGAAIDPLGHRNVKPVELSSRFPLQSLERLSVPPAYLNCGSTGSSRL